MFVPCNAFSSAREGILLELWCIRPFVFKRVLTALLQSNSASAEERWIVILGKAVDVEHQLEGLLRAAEARGCTLKNQTDRIISIDCPTGIRPSSNARRATRYTLHDATTNNRIKAREVHDGTALGVSFDGSGVRVAVALLAAISQGPDVIHLSLGGGKSTAENCDTSGDPAVDVINIEAAGAGIPVVVSSGNERYKDGISFPACASSAIAVGAVYQRDEGRVQWLSGCVDRRATVDQVTCFSNSGPALDVRSALVATALELGDKKNRERNGSGRIDSVRAADYVEANLTPCVLDADCDDGNLCNGVELCDAGQCVGGSPVICDDGNACKGVETCDAASGSCLSGTPPNCNAGNSCTDDSCDSTAGCVNVDNGTCNLCIPVSKGRCNCDGKCTRKEARFGSCGDCL